MSILCSMLGGSVVSQVAITYPTGVQFQKSNNERIRVTSIGNKPANGRVFVISAWMKFDSLPSPGSTEFLVVGQRFSNNENSHYFLSITSSSNIRIYAHWGTDFGILDVSPGTAFVTGQWYHVVAKWNQLNTGRSQVWLNGTRLYDAAGYNVNADITWNSAVSYGIGFTDHGTYFNSTNFDGCLSQIYVLMNNNYDIDTNISKFYNNGYVDFGSAGTSSGLPSPHIFHDGSTQATFDDIKGSITGTVTVTGTLSTCS